MVQEFLGQDPLSGHLFLFFNKRRDRAKILFWDRDGLLIVYNRLGGRELSKTFDPSSRSEHASGSAGLELSATDLTLILSGIDLTTARRRKRYSREG